MGNKLNTLNKLNCCCNIQGKPDASCTKPPQAQKSAESAESVEFAERRLIRRAKEDEQDQQKPPLQTVVVDFEEAKKFRIKSGFLKETTGYDVLVGNSKRKATHTGGYAQAFQGTYDKKDAWLKVYLSKDEAECRAELDATKELWEGKEPQYLQLHTVSGCRAENPYSIVMGHGENLEGLLDKCNDKFKHFHDHLLDKFKQIAAIVKHMHDHNYVHSDLHHGNIVFDGKTLRVIDFGLSKRVGAPSPLVDTTLYWWPPQFHPMVLEKNSGERPTVQKSIDIWALGAFYIRVALGKDLADVTNVDLPDVAAKQLSLRKQDAKVDEFLQFVRTNMLLERAEGRPNIETVLEKLKANDEPSKNGHGQGRTDSGVHKL